MNLGHEPSKFETFQRISVDDLEIIDRRWDLIFIKWNIIETCVIIFEEIFFFSLPRTKIVREFKVGHLHDDEMFYIKENCDTSVFHLQKSFEDILDLPLLCNNNVAAVCDILYHVEFNANYIDLKYQKGNRSQTMKDVFPIKKHSVKISVCSVPPSKWTCTYLNFPPFFCFVLQMMLTSKKLIFEFWPVLYMMLTWC